MQAEFKFDHFRKPYMERMLALAHMGLWRWKVGEQNIYFSETLYEIFHLNPDLFQPTLQYLRTITAGRDLARMFVKFNRMISDGGEMETTLTIQPNEDGPELHARCFAACERNESGHITAVYGFLQDITQEKRQQKSLEKALARAEAANETKAGFLATMSHELRTPLNAIIGFSEMMQGEVLGPVGNRRYADYVDSIHSSGRHLLEIINDILDMSKIEAGRHDLVFQPVNMEKTVRVARHMIEQQAKQKNITIHTDPDARFNTIEADQRAITQILLNIFSNAVKFTPEDGEIKISAQSDSKTFSLSVKPFSQADDAMSRQYEGTGLGLAITKRLVEHHNGALTIESQIGQGTTVKIILPRLRDDNQLPLFTPSISATA